MDLDWLDDVLALLEEGNMTRAAARRNITQPAFSRRIRSFEHWVGIELLDRQPNMVHLNPSLLANEAEIRSLQNAIRDLRTKIRLYDPASSTLSIAAQHAPIHSTFADIALYAKRHFPALKFRLRAGNLRDCMAMFLRRDTSLLLCYQSSEAPPLPFGDSVRQLVWGADVLVPVVAGGLRAVVRDDGSIPADTPAIVYPENSYFGEVLTSAKRAFSSPSLCEMPLVESALSSGIKQLVLNGIGVGWLPYSMVYKEIDSGDAISLASQLGQVPLESTLYADSRDHAASALFDLWAFKHAG